jgi:hypothetical protein
MYNIKHVNYVPDPKPVSSDYMIGCHYFPGWKPGAHQGFKAIQDFPERTPLLGYYDESNPEVTDWEIKWAVEHGINFFIYCWYRKKDNVGEKVTLEDLHLPHAIHEGLFNAKYRRDIQYGIMWEAGNCGGAADKKDLLENLMPFWLENYFTDSSYLKLNNKPVLFVYDYFEHIMKALGGPEGMREAFFEAGEMCRAYGFDGLHIQSEYRYEDIETIRRLKSAGYDQHFAYCWHTLQQFPTSNEAIEQQMNLMELRKRFDPYFFITTASVGWDPFPWNRNTPEKVTRWKLSPDEYRSLLEKVKAIAESLPEDSVGHRMIMLDNWNEWSEGHYLAPHVSGGFAYLEAVREVFTHRDNLPDYRLPAALGLGPYDQEHLKEIQK